MAAERAHPIVASWFAAMRKGRRGEDELLALFHDDAEYIEPFGGQPRQHRGKAAIRACLVEGWETPLPDLSLTVERVDVDGATVRARWVCRSSAFPAPMHGLDVYTLRDGLIARLESSLQPTPAPEP